ncbi:Nramp family divalent metal transporter [Fulvivirgaceae bacterium BMA12]|uniref:Nramp family divalent metal transporter n=1 Tax=Agaribacillus aureus TaxID=3051825 RepID=A0ABT8LH55_9BACT|nr:Nramp family divalent metal transporter [Fulvivirgaceae bacterium BMA12]
MKALKIFLASITPGLFLIGYNIGTGSITTMASAGASYGMSMTWALLLSCIFTYFLVVIFGQYTAVTGNTVLSSFKQQFGKGFALFVLGSLLLSEWVSCMGVMGVVIQVVQEWSRPLTASGEGFNPVLLAAIFGAVLYGLFWQGQHRFFEKILSVFVGIMGITFILTMFMVIPDPKEVIAGLVPKIPDGTNKLLLVAGMVGTTMGAILYVVRSILVQEKGWTVRDLKLEKRDAFVSAAAMFVLSIAIMASAAGTLYPRGLKVENAIDMVNLLEPLAGRFAISIFVAGIVSAGLSSLFPIVILAPWLLADYNNKPRNMRSTSSRLLVLFGVALGFVVPVFGGRPVFVMIISQALAAIATPVVLGLMLILINRPSIMGGYKASRQRNLLMGVIVLFTVMMAVAGIVGIAGQI